MHPCKHGGVPEFFSRICNRWRILPFMFLRFIVFIFLAISFLHSIFHPYLSSFFPYFLCNSFLPSGVVFVSHFLIFFSSSPYWNCGLNPRWDYNFLLSSFHPSSFFPHSISVLPSLGTIPNAATNALCQRLDEVILRVIALSLVLWRDIFHCLLRTVIPKSLLGCW